MIVYLDTSAAWKILIDELGTQAMWTSFTGWQAGGDDIVSSYLLHTELHFSCTPSCTVRRGVRVSPSPA